MEHSIEITPMDDRTPLLQQTSKDEIEDGREVDDLDEIKVTNCQDRSVLQTNKCLNQTFHEKFENLRNSSINSCSIFKVNVGLRESNPGAYTPKMISIGPYHKKNPELFSMEKYKLLYLQRFLQRKEGIIDVDYCIRELEKLKDEALKCYDNTDSDIDVGKFSEMLLLDGCFVVEYIREFCRIEDVDPLIKSGCIDNQVIRDLLLLENQLPFFVLTMLHDMTMNEDTIPFTKMVKIAFSYSLPKMTPASFMETEGDVKNIKHLLQLVHMSCHPLKSKTTLPGTPSMEVEHSTKTLCWNPLQILRSKLIPKSKDYPTILRDDDMPNATELREAGVTFSKVGNIYKSFGDDNLTDSTSLFDIRFENGLMEIPCFQVDDGTETVLRNLIAYEQHSPDIKPRYFSDFQFFMDYLIDSDKDVNLLRQKGIIKNLLGEDNEVARLFNKLGQGVAIASDFYFIDECRKAIQHCEKPWNRMKASLRRNYFHTPWAGISTVAAVILLSLTFIQTVLAFLSVLK